MFQGRKLSKESELSFSLCIKRQCMHCCYEAVLRYSILKKKGIYIFILLWAILKYLRPIPRECFTLTSFYMFY